MICRDAGLTFKDATGTGQSVHWDGQSVGISGATVEAGIHL